MDRSLLCGVPNDGLLGICKYTEGLTRDETWDAIVNSTRNLLYSTCSVTNGHAWSVMEQACARVSITDVAPWGLVPSANL